MFIGVDLGGTKIAAALVSATGKIVTDVNIPTEASKGKTHVLGAINKAIRHLIQTSPEPVKAIGLGVPGPILYEKGIVIGPPNLPGWKQVNLKKILEKEFSRPVFIDNDANCAALAEARFGAGVGRRHFIYITVSTGIGGGIIINGQLYRGANGSAGEFGHMIIDSQGFTCGCGNVGCFEAMASGTAVRKRAGMDGASVELAARQGDKKALAVINETAHYLAIGISNLVNIFNPELVILGGGVSKMRELLLNPVRKEFKKYALYLPAKSVKIVRAKLGTNAGILGAAALCL
ncbi:MAG: ROK family protein [Candidatus Margulisbacteria bacterium]|nr:ROK family protein [Candidatus Margulisiibacteriota bacterium]MBU1867751.1 ROK family protein [Candidatus Margulisiibacteriota bacterium]